MSRQLERRQFLACGLGAGASALVLSSSRLAFGYEANERLNLAVVGVAGYGAHYGFTTAVHMYQSAAITALCDVDMRKVIPTLAMWEERGRQWPHSDDPTQRRAAEHYERLAENPPPLFEDFRRMLDEMDDRIDAVVCATPDHSHAVISAAALRAGKHVFAEKPLTISAHEARALYELTARQKVATTVNTHGAASPRFRRGVELVRRGVIGPVEEVHIFFGRGGRNFQRTPQGSRPVPPELNWNLWLAQLAWREYHPDWINRIAWRGTSLGELGNFAPHAGNLAFLALDVNKLWQRQPHESSQAPIRMEAECSEVNRISYPRWERIRWHIPARGELPPVTFTWHHGYPPGYGPGSREMLVELLRDHGAAEEDMERLLSPSSAGAVLVGSRGLLVANSHNTTFALLPAKRFEEVEQGQPQTLPTSPGHYREWVEACRGGPVPLTNFEYAGRFAEFITLGEVATRFAGESFAYDPVAGTVLDHSRANEALGYEYRDGWTLLHAGTA